MAALCPRTALNRKLKSSPVHHSGLYRGRASYSSSIKMHNLAVWTMCIFGFKGQLNLINSICTRLRGCVDLRLSASLIGFRCKSNRLDVKGARLAEVADLRGLSIRITQFPIKLMNSEKVNSVSSCHSPESPHQSEAS